NAGEDESITISGDNFYSNVSKNTVTFGGSVKATVASASLKSLTVVVPQNAKSGTIKVETNLGSATSTDTFTVYRYFAYFNVNSTFIEIQKMNPSTGSLTPISGSPFDLGFSAGQMQLHPSKKYAYINRFGRIPGDPMGFDAGEVHGFSVDSGTGILNPLSTPTFSADANPSDMKFHPSGNFLYWLNYSSDDVTKFSIDQNTGLLTPLGNNTLFSIGSNTDALAMDPSGKFLYVAVNSTDAVYGYSINSGTGALTQIGGSFPSPTAMFWVTDMKTDITGNFLYIMNTTTVNIQGFQINQGTGGLTNLNGGTAFPGTERNWNLAVHPSGKYIYTVNLDGNNPTSTAMFALHSIDQSTGFLSVSTTYPRGTRIDNLSIDPQGKFLYGYGTADARYYIFSINQGDGT
ncbi:MAG: beta-propeller fold lactonase family protein, partial [Leptospira sp.]|nr:beta-propeller fold lactonase family protein [Leptospira sp.]